MLGGATQKISTIVELAEELYDRVNELRQRLEAVDDTVESTGARVEAIEGELAEQRAILEAIAADHGVDVATVIEAVEAESATEDDAEADAPSADQS